MFGIGMTELVVIFVVGLLVLGPKRLPEMARSLGRTLAEFRRASSDLHREFLDVADEARIDTPRARPRSPARESPAEEQEEAEAGAERAVKPDERGPDAGASGAAEADAPEPAPAEKPSGSSGG